MKPAETQEPFFYERLDFCHVGKCFRPSELERDHSVDLLRKEVILMQDHTVEEIKKLMKDLGHNDFF